MSEKPEDEVVTFADAEVLSVDALNHVDTREARVGITLANPLDGEQLSFSISVADAEKMILRMAAICYVLHERET